MGKTFQFSCVLALLGGLSACSGSSQQSSGAGGQANASGAGGDTTSSAGSTSVSGQPIGGKGSQGGGSSSAGQPAGGSSNGTPSKPGEVAGCTMFPAEDAWNLDVSSLPVDATWTKKVQDLVGAAKLHPDYGVDGQDLYGIPINVVPETQPSVPVSFDDYPDESDPGPYPFPGPDEVIIEGNDPTACDGDCHLLVIQEGSCMLYEGYACEHREGSWHCANGAKWDLTKIGRGQRPQGWTSADAAGLAIAPGLLRVAEVRAREITHALRFTLECSTNKYVAPASHYAVPGGCDPADGPPMGTRVRLKADFDITSLSPSAQAVARGMQKYGMILADNGSNFYFQGEASADWTEDDIEPLKTIPASAFEVLQMPPLMP